MGEKEFLVERFEADRARLRAVAYRMLGSLSEADDALQEAWLNVTRSGASGVENLGGWLTTVVARVCLDMLRSRKSRREDPIESGEVESQKASGNPEQETLLADSVGVALLVVLETLAPAERIAFVLHDTFGVSFDEIAPIVGRTPEAARQLASRARRRVQGAPAADDTERAAQREAVHAFLEALRAGDIEKIIAVLDPDVVVHGEGGAALPIRGARAWAQGAVAFSKQARFMQPALVDGAYGLVLAPQGKLYRALRMKVVAGKIADVEVIANPTRLAALDIAVAD